MPSIEEIRARIKRNFPNQAQSAAQRQKLLEWNRETATTMTSSHSDLRIVKHSDGNNTFEYMLYTLPSPTAAARKIAGPFITAKECRDAAQDYVNGVPMQADLT